jgi:hypothetical protein
METAIATSIPEKSLLGGKMTAHNVKYCDYCHSSIVASQRWVRQKFFNPHLDGRDAAYHYFHAEPFVRASESCWEKHQIERDTARTAS